MSEKTVNPAVSSDAPNPLVTPAPPRLHLIVAISPSNGALASQIVAKNFDECLEIFNSNMMKFFQRQSQENKELLDPNVQGYINLVSHGLHDEAYGVFLQHTKRSDFKLCGVYKHSVGRFKKLKIKVIKGIAA